MRCADCGATTTPTLDGPLCADCAHTAAALGFTVEQRLSLLAAAGDRS
ncbi:hypothetical protein KNU09_gp07 [Gordonia phage TillyBobJoe]|uniref:Uncharacterized protein n=2 Tax=Wizardvirus TaxID=2169658 RepID=A0A7D5K6Y7_9CAUD|nr:hypothetical protein KNU09_gp07 [Gordonia phage TillyBobJoe]YP_010109269.1 hypothetical protein KNV15_gp07 [Gordonia phage Jambalaya]AXQ62324.1 hypothetical protein SEA_TILLYBOBJOE_7 [Gordonia phage TillyBobJoe]QLF84137.1 hypothetical protein SEA_JAMBALAYA_7 [Gordonia phage Jambalaya]WKW87134.1 hypothetical protein SAVBUCKETDAWG_7 [Gordonia phage Savbucketdawg]